MQRPEEDIRNPLLFPTLVFDTKSFLELEAPVPMAGLQDPGIHQSPTPPMLGLQEYTVMHDFFFNVGPRDLNSGFLALQ